MDPQRDGSQSVLCSACKAMKAALAAMFLFLSASSMAQMGQYIGQMHTTFQTGDTGGVGQTMESTVNVLVSIQPPYRIPPELNPLPDLVDTNPFFIFVTGFRDPNAPRDLSYQPGDIHVVSATPQISDNPPGRRYVMQHWVLALNGNQISGEYLEPVSIDKNNYFVSQELGSPLAWNPGALATGGNPFETNQAIACPAFLSKRTVLSGTVDPATGRIDLLIEGHGGGYMKGMCIVDLAFRSEIKAVLDPQVPTPVFQLTPQAAARLNNADARR